MSEIQSEKFEMSCVEFASGALRSRIAPPSTAPSVKARITKASRSLGWTVSRTNDVWYGDPRVSIKVDELKKIEAVSGLIYGQQELNNANDLIARADALLYGSDPDFHGAFVAALRGFFGSSHRAGTGR